MSGIQVADEMFIAGLPQQIAAVVHERWRWTRWWPGMTYTVTEDRAEKGIRFKITKPIQGTMEIWLEPMKDGILLHYFLHAEPGNAINSHPKFLQKKSIAAKSQQHDLLKLNQQYRIQGKIMAFEIKRVFDVQRAAGEPLILTSTEHSVKNS